MEWNKINSEKDLPETNDDGYSEDLIGTIEHKKKRYVINIYLQNKEWCYVESNRKVSEPEFKVIAWQPYPNPLK